MGKCISKKEQNFEIDSIDLIMRKCGRVLKLSNEEVKRLRLRQRIHFPEDSAMGRLDDGSLIVCGGSEGTEYTKCAYRVYCAEVGVEKLCDLPFGVELGNLYPKGNWVYLVGALSKTYGGVPLTRFNLEENYWEVFHEDFNKAQVKCEELVLSDLVCTGTAMLEGSVYLVGGKFSRKQTFSKQIFKVDLENFKMTLVEVELPFEISSPICGVVQKSIIIVGGVTDNVPNGQPLRLNFLPKPSLKLLKRNSTVLSCNYPPITSASRVIFVSLPSIEVFDAELNKWLLPNQFIRRKIKACSKREPSIIQRSPDYIINEAEQGLPDTKKIFVESAEDSNDKGHQQVASPFSNISSIPPKNPQLEVDSESSQESQASVKNYWIEHSSSSESILAMDRYTSPSETSCDHNLAEPSNFTDNYLFAENPLYKGSKSINKLLENSRENSFCKTEDLIKLVDLVAESFNIPPLPTSSIDQFFNELKIKDQVSASDLKIILGSLLQETTYSLKDSINLLRRLHEALNKPELEDQDVNSILEPYRTGTALKKNKCIELIAKAVEFVTAKYN